MPASTSIRSFRWLLLATGLAFLLLGCDLLLDRFPYAALLFDPAGHVPREMTAFGILAFAGFWFGVLIACPFTYRVPLACPLCARTFPPGKARWNHCPDCHIPLKPQRELDTTPCPDETEWEDATETPDTAEGTEGDDTTEASKAPETEETEQGTPEQDQRQAS
ncbi:MAG: hypothetical protein AB7E32_09690 [Desulfovibrio sp.]